jgi:hypothetical protein
VGEFEYAQRQSCHCILSHASIPDEESPSADQLSPSKVLVDRPPQVVSKEVSTTRFTYFRPFKFVASCNTAMILLDMNGRPAQPSALGSQGRRAEGDPSERL